MTGNLKSSETSCSSTNLIKSSENLTNWTQLVCLIIRTTSEALSTQVNVKVPAQWKYMLFKKAKIMLLPGMSQLIKWNKWCFKPRNNCLEVVLSVTMFLEALRLSPCNCQSRVWTLAMSLRRQLSWSSGLKSSDICKLRELRTMKTLNNSSIKYAKCLNL